MSGKGHPCFQRSGVESNAQVYVPDQSSRPATSYLELADSIEPSSLLSIISFKAGKVEVLCAKDSKVISTSRPMVHRVESEDSRI